MTRLTETRCTAVLCDVDGVVRLWDEPARVALEVRYGLAPGTVASVAFAPDRLNPAITGRVTDAEWRAGIIRDLADHCGSATNARELVDAWGRLSSRNEPVLDLLARAQTHATVALISNGTTRLERDLDLMGVTDTISIVVNSARVGIAKPAPGIYHAAAQRVGVEPGRCLFVDDSASHSALRSRSACAPTSTPDRPG